MDTNLTDQQIINQVVPAWARALNALYSVFFQPINYVLSYFDKSDTKQMITDFEADEAAQASRKQ